MPRRSVQYTILAYLLTVAAAGVMALFGQDTTGLAGTVLGVLVMTFPLISVIVVQKGIQGQSLGEVLPWRVQSWGWMALAVAVPILVNLGVSYTSLLFPGVEPAQGWEGLLARLEGVLPPEQVAAQRDEVAQLPLPAIPMTVLGALLAGPTINALVAFGEEAGWRGLMFADLRDRGIWRASLVIGLIWGFWHAPLTLLGHNYPEHRLIGVFLFPVVTTLLTPWMLLLRERTGSVLSAAVFHGVYNATAGLPWAVAIGGSDLTVGLASVSSVIVLAVADLGLWAWLRSRGGAWEPAG